MIDFQDRTLDTRCGAVHSDSLETKSFAGVNEITKATTEIKQPNRSITAN